MRIRSIRPEFWSSEDIALLDWHHRLVYIGLWSYVDDNGVGRDNVRLIVADLFPLDDDLEEASRRVTGALKTLFDRGHIVRYEVNGRRFLHIVAWSTHQRIEKPSRSRYPSPSSEDAIVSPTTPGDVRSRSKEKGRRGEGEKVLTSSDESNDTIADTFEVWWKTYDKPVGKKTALAKYRLALKKPGVTHELLLAAAGEYVAFQRSEGAHRKFTKDPTTWLNGECWNDERAARAINEDRKPSEGGQPWWLR